MTVSAGSVRHVLTASDEPLTMLTALQALQAEYGYVPPDAVALVAEHLNVSRADVYGVLTFYSDLRTSPPAPIEVRICLGEACQAVGARQLLSETAARPDADCHVERVFCMGNCALGPTAVVNGRLLGRATHDSVASAVAAHRTTP